MGEMKNFITTLHQSTSRNYIERMNNNKIECMIEAKKYSENYWDGDRKFGYGGYKYIPDRWKPLAQELIKTYSLNNNSKIIDIGCGKGFLLFEILKLLPGITVTGVDFSNYGIENAHSDIKKNIIYHDVREKLPFSDKEFDLSISITTFHNLKINELELSLKEMERIGKNGYLVVESYRDEKELFNLQCWALTCESFFEVDEWEWIFNHLGYNGDYEFIFFE